MAMTKAEKAEVEALRVKLALRWPDEAPAKHLFSFGDYDRACGEPFAGTFFVVWGKFVERVELRAKRPDEEGWKQWRFNDSTQVRRGLYFATERDAALTLLWRECHNAARDLRTFWRMFDAAAAEAS